MKATQWDDSFPDDEDEGPWVTVPWLMGRFIYIVDPLTGNAGWIRFAEGMLLEASWTPSQEDSEDQGLEA